MVITKIEQQLKTPNRYNIYADDEFIMGVYSGTLLKFGLRKGDELISDKVKEIRDYDEYHYGKTVAYKFLSYKPRSIKEVKNKLTYKKISKETVEKIMEHLMKYDFINDEDYAKMYAAEKINRKGIGKSMLKFKMIDKGINSETVSKVIDESYPEEKQIEAGRKLLEKYIRKQKTSDKLELKKKSYQYLFSKGYDYPIISQILNFRSEES